jgi:hypothetical protein
MKKIIIPLLTAILSLSPVIVTAADQGGNSGGSSTVIATTVAGLVTSIRNAAPADRQKLVQDAIRDNPEISNSLVAALITAFPTESAVYTQTVVNAVLSLSIPNDSKSQILTAVAAAAVPAALQLPAASVPDLVAAVNAVKNALANVPVAFAAAVQNYVAPVTANSKEIIQATNNKVETVSQATLQK